MSYDDNESSAGKILLGLLVLFLLMAASVLAGYEISKLYCKKADPPCCPQPCPACPDCDKSKVDLGELHKSAVAIQTAEGCGWRTRGSGLQITWQDRQYVLTAGHVAELFHDIRVHDRSEPSDFFRPFDEELTVARSKVGLLTRTARTSGRVVWVDKDRDVALVRAKDSLPSPVTLGPLVHRPADGDDLYSVGQGIFPWNMSRGTYSGESDGLLTFEAGTAWYGHSGAGVFVRRDRMRLVGLFHGGYTAGRERVALAVPLTKVIESLSEYDQTH